MTHHTWNCYKIIFQDTSDTVLKPTTAAPFRLSHSIKCQTVLSEKQELSQEPKRKQRDIDIVLQKALGVWSGWRPRSVSYQQSALVYLTIPWYSDASSSDQQLIYQLPGQQNAHLCFAFVGTDKQAVLSFRFEDLLLNVFSYDESLIVRVSPVTYCS